MRAVGLHPDRFTRTARAAFIDAGFDPLVRTREIEQLPQKRWKGHMVHQVLCRGRRGKGPHYLWLHEWQLWSLISVKELLCPFHQGDQPVKITQIPEQMELWPR